MLNSRDKYAPWPLYGLMLLVIVAAIVRGQELAPSSLWTDDAWVALIIKQGWENIWYTSMTSIGFRALIGAMLEIFGLSSLSAQILPFIFGLILIPMTYHVARQLYLSPVFAFFAASMIATSRSLVEHSVRVKQYTGEALSTLIILSCLLWLLKNPRHKIYWWIFCGLCCFAVVYSGLMLIPVASAVGFILFYYWRVDRQVPGEVIPVAAITVAFMLMWYLLLLKPAVSSNLIIYWQNKFININDGIVNLFTSIAFAIERIFSLALDNNFFHIAGGIFLTVIALYFKGRITIFLLLPLFIAMLSAVVGIAPVGDRTDAYFVPLLIITVAIGMQSWFEHCDNNRSEIIRLSGKYAGVLLFSVMLLWEFPDRLTPKPYPQQDVRTLTGIWTKNKKSTDHLFVYSGAKNAFRLYSEEPLIIRNKNGELIRDDDRKITRGRINNQNITLFEGRMRKNPHLYFNVIQNSINDSKARVWLLTAHTWKKDTPILKQAILKNGYVKEQTWDTGGDAALVLYTRKPS